MHPPPFSVHPLWLRLCRAVLLQLGLARIFALGLLTASHAGAWQMKQAPLMTPWAALVDTNHPLPEYPRPQLVRTNWLNLNGLWQFQPGATNDPVPAGQTLTNQILVPYPMESAISGIMQYHEFSWYRQLFTVPPAWSGQRIILHLDAVDWQATAYVNGQKVGTHKGGYDPFSYDLTPYLSGSSNELIIQVYNPVDNGGQPRGKQTLYPGGIMYTSSTGIWQPVWLEPVDASGVNNLQLVPDVDNARLRLTVNTYATNGVTVVATVSSNGLAVSSAAGLPQTELNVPVPNPNLWSPENPFLYNLQISTIHNGVTNDNVSSYFGMRKISLSVVNGVPKILLNNQPYFGMGPLDQGFWPDGIYTAPTDAALEYDLLREKALGFNAVRKHIKVERQRWYYWADTLGLLVWQDMPSCNSYTGNTNPPAVDPVQFQAELTALVTNHWNSPAVIMWDIFNEGQGEAGSADGVGQASTASLVQLAKTLDPARLVNQASGGNYFGVGDVLDYHAYPDPGDPVSATQGPVDGEFGGIAWHVNGHLWNAALAGTGYLLASSTNDIATLYDGYITEAVGFKSAANGGLNAAIYTQITDVENECNGLMTYDRLVKPDPNKIENSNQKAISGQITVTTVVPTSQAVPQTWQWTTNTPATNWYATGFNSAGWNTGAGGFGTADPGVTPNTPWTTLGYIYLRRSFNPGALTAQQMSNLVFTVYHDEDVAIYVNGVLAGSASGYSTAYVNLPLTPPGLAAIIPNGTNLLAVSCYQTTGGQFIDVGISDQVLVANTYTNPLTLPMIIQAPAPLSVYVGGSAAFTIQALGGNLNYQWTLGGTPIAGATNAALTLTNVVLANAGNYEISVSNTLGSASNSAALTVLTPPPLALGHRYSFTSDASDSIGGANGTLVNHAAIANGAARLPGQSTSASTNCSYVALPNGIVSNYNSITVEAWLTDTAGSTWAEAWCFGDSSTGAGNPPGSGTYYIGLIPHSGPGDMRVAFNNSQTEIDVIDPSTPLPLNQEEYVVVTYDAPSTTARLYLNGVQVGVNSGVTTDHAPANLGDTFNDWLGRDQFGSDPAFQGSLDELRIWNGAVSPLYLAVSTVAGPNVVVTNLTPASVNVSVNPSMAYGQTQQAGATGAFVQAASVPITSSVTNWSSSNPGVITVNSSGLITAVGGGSASISAIVAGTAGTSPAIIVASPSFYQQALLSYNPMAYWPLDETNGTVAYDLIGGHNGTYVGGYTLSRPGPTNAFFGPSSQAAGFDGTSAYVDIPEGPFNVTNALTTVAWVKLLADNHFGGLFGHGDSSWRMSVNPSGEPGANDGSSASGDATGASSIFDDNWHLVAYAYTGVPGQSNNGALYVDGVPVANNTVMSAPVGNGLDVWIGGSPDYGTARLLSANLAHAAIFNQTLSAAQIQGIYSGVYAGPVSLGVTRSGFNVVLNWRAGILLQAPSLSGPWTTNSAAVSGYTVPATNGNQFFKLLINP
jgi:hypothetical protein